MKTLNGNLTTVIIFVFVLAGPHSALGLDCSHGATTSAKGNNLFLYFPTSLDSSFEGSISGVPTSPLAAFDVADLDSGIGTTSALRDRITELVTEDYCEFNVKVTKTTASPSTTGVTRWQIVGIGTDSKALYGGNLFGISSLGSNAGDADPQDFTRVWAASFDDAYGGTGGVLNGTNSTLDRWATAIAGTVSHEAAHNYGVSHCEAGDFPGRTGPQTIL